MKKKICLFILIFIFIPMLAMAQYSVPFWQFMEYATANWGALDPNGIFHQIGVDENGKFCFKYKDGTVTKFTSSSGGAEINKNLTIKSTDPSIIFDVDPNAGDTNFWIGVQADAEDDDDDKIQIGKGTTEGTNPFVTIDTDGKVGIGTTDPNDNVYIKGSGIGLVLDGGKAFRFCSGGAAGIIDYDDTSYFAIRKNSNANITAGSSASSTTIMSFQSDGEINMMGGANVGIGVSSPSSYVDIQKLGTAKSNLNILELTNTVNAADMDNTSTGILWNFWYYDPNTPAAADAARIRTILETDWTSTASTQDAALVFETGLNGTVGEKVRIQSDGDIVHQGSYNYASDTAADDDYIITFTPAPSAYSNGMVIYFDANNPNTGACTVNINSLGAKSLKSLHDNDPPNSYIEDGSMVHAIYDGTNFQMLQPDANP